MEMCCELADLNSSHIFNKEKKLAGQDWVRETFARDMKCVEEQCTMGRITGFHRIQC